MLAENPALINNLQPVRVDSIRSRTGTTNPIINSGPGPEGGDGRSYARRPAGDPALWEEER